MNYLLAVLSVAAALFAMTMVYVAWMLAAARRLKGTPKLLVGMVTNSLYTLVSLLLVAWLTDSYRRPWSVAVALIVIAPSLFYVSRVRFEDLKQAGYFPDR